jgi:hypothetical protein
LPLPPKEFEKLLLKAQAESASVSAINPVEVLQKAVQGETIDADKEPDKHAFNNIPAEDADWMEVQGNALTRYEQAFDGFFRDVRSNGPLSNLYKYKNNLKFRMRTDRFNSEGKKSWVYCKENADDSVKDTIEIVQRYESGSEPPIFREWGYGVMKGEKFNTLFLDPRPSSRFWMAMIMASGLFELQKITDSDEGKNAMQEYYGRKGILAVVMLEMGDHLAKDNKMLRRSRKMCTRIEDGQFKEMLSGQNNPLRQKIIRDFDEAMGGQPCANEVEENFRDLFMVMNALSAHCGLDVPYDDTASFEKRMYRMIELMQDYGPIRDFATQRLILTNNTDELIRGNKSATNLSSFFNPEFKIP